MMVDKEKKSSDLLYLWRRTKKKLIQEDCLTLFEVEKLPIKALPCTCDSKLFYVDADE